MYVLCCAGNRDPILGLRLSENSGYGIGSKQKISTTADGGRKSGRAVFDNQGRASWEWQTATGVFETDVTHEQLQNLEAADLSVLET